MANIRSLARRMIGKNHETININMYKCVYIYILYNSILYIYVKSANIIQYLCFFREMKEEIGLDERLFDKTWIHIDAVLFIHANDHDQAMAISRPPSRWTLQVSYRLQRPRCQQHIQSSWNHLALERKLVLPDFLRGKSGSQKWRKAMELDPCGCRTIVDVYS